MIDRVAALLQTDLFADLSPAELEPLARAAKVRVLARDEYVIRSGDRADELIVVASGKLKDMIITKEGDEIIHVLFVPGMVCGEPGFFAPERERVANVVALEPSTILVLQRADVVPFLMRYPAALMRLLERMAVMIRSSAEIIVSMAHLPLPQRLLLRFLMIADRRNPNRPELVTAKITQSDLAAMVGASREHVNRAVQQLIADGVVRGEDGRYVICDPENLRREMFPGWMM